MTPGYILADKYRLVSLIGRGGMGTVWCAERLTWGSHVAVKIMDRVNHARGDVLVRFQQEARLAANLRSAHVVQVLDDGHDLPSGVPFIVMELLVGESLAQRLARSGRLSPAETATIVTHVARALGLAHELQMIHRDLKPDNIFLVPNDDEFTAKVLDFGIAKWNAETFPIEAPTTTGSAMGTPSYMSPEQIQDSKRVDHRTDLWSLAVIASECLTGRHTFESDNLLGLALQICNEPPRAPSSLGPVPAGFDAWFERATARSPAQRFSSARELADELRRVCGTASSASSASALSSPAASLRSESPTPRAVQVTRVGGVGVDPSAPDGARPSKPPSSGRHAGESAFGPTLALGSPSPVPHSTQGLTRTQHQDVAAFRGPRRRRALLVAAGSCALLGFGLALLSARTHSASSPGENRSSAAAARAPGADERTPGAAESASAAARSGSGGSPNVPGVAASASRAESAGVAAFAPGGESASGVAESEPGAEQLAPSVAEAGRESPTLSIVPSTEVRELWALRPSTPDPSPSVASRAAPESESGSGAPQGREKAAETPAAAAARRSVRPLGAAGSTARALRAKPPAGAPAPAPVAQASASAQGSASAQTAEGPNASAPAAAGDSPAAAAAPRAAALALGVAPPPPGASAIASTTPAATPSPAAPAAAPSVEPLQPPPAPPSEPKPPPFDRNAAKLALEKAAEHAAQCRPAGGPRGQGRVQVRFEPNGKVGAAWLLTPEFDNTTTASCVLMLFRRASIPGFDGPPELVVKSFEIR